MKSFLKSILRETNNPILHNKFVLYAVFIIALIYLYGLSVQRSWLHIAIFILIGYVTTFFSKNMMVILLIATIFTFVLKNGTNIKHEGFEEQLQESPESQEVPLSTDSEVYLNNEEEQEEQEQDEEEQEQPQEQPEEEKKESFSGYSKNSQLDKVISMFS
jgi:hypothetical protein